jgi:thiamine biosynthesis lipoprotein
MRRGLIACVGLLLAAAASAAGCAPPDAVVVSRPALGTVVTVTAYGTDDAAVGAAIEEAYEAIAAVESELDAYDPASAVSAFNADPYTEQPLPPDAVTVLDAIGHLGVTGEFSPTLLAVSRLYDFEGSGTVPAPSDLDLALGAARGFERTASARARFVPSTSDDPRLAPGGALAPGLDFGGAAKGLALDRAREALRASGAVTAALIAAGSTSVTLGSKPDRSAWRIGVEDPRDPGTVVAVFRFSGDGALSTSGDYQQAFDAGGVHYHHIIDLATGQPARGVRSLTVAGTDLSGLDSDILSTALFVSGPERALAYARRAGLALYLVDSEGRALVAPAPAGSGLVVTEQATPKR